MLDTRETNILRHALTGRGGAAAERLSRRLTEGGALDPARLPRDERVEGADALDAYLAREQSFGDIAANAARQLRP